MSFLLKIVEGPNKGAEIALVEGVAVTLGKGDDCDIVLADATMPADPVAIEANSGGVVVGGEPLEPLHVRTIGATSFAVGPADAPWSELVWPKKGSGEPGNGEAAGGAEGDTSEVSSPSPRDESASEESSSPRPERKRRGGCCGCVVVLLVLALVLACLAWVFRKRLNETGCLDGIRDSRLVEKVVAVSKDGYARTSELIATWRKSEEPRPSEAKPAPTLPGVAERYGLSLSETGGVAKLSGNLKTRRERLAATAEAYALRPGVELDLSDDESLRTSAEDALFSLTEGALKVSVATNRVVGIVGRARSAASLKRTLEALNADVPRLRGVDVTGVAFSLLAAEPQVGGVAGGPSPAGAVVARPSRSSRAVVQQLPVCGILTTPYPCLISRDGRRYLEGAEIGGSVILKIDADSVVLTNSTGRFTWKP